MPDIILTVTTEVANRLADAAVLENPLLSGASGSEKAEYVRQKIITMLKNWVTETERNDLKSTALAELDALGEQLNQINQTPIVPPEVT